MWQERRLRQQRERQAADGAVPRVERELQGWNEGPDGVGMVEPSRGRSSQALLVDRTCEMIQEVHQLVERVPGLELRRPFTLPGGSKYIYPKLISVTLGIRTT